MKELKDYLKAKDSLDAKFGGFIGYRPVEDMTDFNFVLNEFGVEWFDEDDNEYSEDHFGYSLDSKKKYIAVYIDSCTGDDYVGIFDVSKQLKEDVE